MKKWNLGWNWKENWKAKLSLLLESTIGFLLITIADRIFGICFDRSVPLYLQQLHDSCYLVLGGIITKKYYDRIEKPPPKQ